MATTLSPFSSRTSARLPAFPLAIGGAVVLCAVLDLGLLDWIRIGAPAHKGEIFFVELVVLLAAGLTVLSVALFAPANARVAAPFLFLVLAWHTGFQVNLDASGRYVLTVFDVLVPLALFLALVGRWYESSPPHAWFRHHWRVMMVFWAFCLWGLVLAIARGIAPDPLLANLKSFLIYPLILIIIPWCISSWRQLYTAVGLLLALIMERTLDGLHQAVTHQILKFQTTLLHGAYGQLVYRIDGEMAATNQYATYLLTGALIVTALIAGSALTKRVRFGLLVPLILMGLAILLTFSRGAWLGTGIALVALPFILRPRQGLSALALAVGVIGIVELLHPGAAGQFLARANSYDSSIIARENYQAIGFEVVKDFPFGAGWGAWFTRVPSGVQAVSGFPWYHDDYLQLATEIGIAGLAVLLWILGSILLMGLRASRRALRPTQAALLAGLTAAMIGMLVQTGTDQFLWHADIAPHIWIVAGLLAAGANLALTDHERKSTIDRSVALAEDHVGRGQPSAAPVRVP